MPVRCRLRLIGLDCPDVVDTSGSVSDKYITSGASCGFLEPDWLEEDCPLFGDWTEGLRGDWRCGQWSQDVDAHGWSWLTSGSESDDTSITSVFVAAGGMVKWERWFKARGKVSGWSWWLRPKGTKHSQFGYWPFTSARLGCAIHNGSYSTNKITSFANINAMLWFQVDRLCRLHQCSRPLLSKFGVECAWAHPRRAWDPCHQSSLRNHELNEARMWQFANAFQQKVCKRLG